MRERESRDNQSGSDINASDSVYRMRKASISDGLLASVPAVCLIHHDMPQTKINAAGIYHGRVIYI